MDRFCEAKSGQGRPVDMAGIYIHIPFCKQKCSYCDFHFSTTHTLLNPLVESLKLELRLRKEELKHEEVNAIYFGGGTPSMLQASVIQELIEMVYAHYKVVSNPEITLEANPDDLKKPYIQALSKTLVNRLSIGIQSFRECDLKFMNRAHTAQEAEDCLEWASNYFDNYSLDLIYGIPNLSAKAWQENIEKALRHNPAHLSAYALTVSPKTLLEHEINNGKRPPLDDDLAFEHFNILRELLLSKGYEHYEISNFALAGKWAVNNTAYWQGKEYLGIGPSAHSYVNGDRSWNISNNVKYIRALEMNQLPSTVEKLSKWDRYNEYVMTGIRTQWGISLKHIESEFGKEALEYLHKESASFIKDRFLLLKDEQLNLHDTKLFYADGIASQLFYV